MREDSRAALHQEVQSAVADAVPEATDVSVTTVPDGFASILSILVDVDDPDVVSRELVDRAMGTAWGLDGGQSNLIRVRFLSDGRVVFLDDIIEEMGAVSPDSGLTLNREELAARYGS